MTPAAVKLTPRDREILDVLTLRVRVLSLAQIGRTWWPGSRDSVVLARRRLKELERDGLTEVLSLTTHPEIPLEAPLACWNPKEPAPDFGQLSHKLKSRWTMAPEEVAAAIATREAGHWFGGSGGRAPRTSEATHDLHLGALFLKVRAQDLALAAAWRSEATLYGAGEGRGDRLPDAMIVRRSGKRVIEFGGAYSKSKLIEFHEFCERRSLPYEVW